MTIALALLAFCLPAAAQNRVAAPSPTLKALEAAALKDPASRPSGEKAKSEAAEDFTGEGPLPFHVQVLSPVELVDPAAPRRPAEPAAPPQAAPKPEAGPSDGRPTYHFVGRKPMDGLTIYTPVQDEAGRDNSTRASGGAGGLLGLLKGLFKFVAIAAGAALIAMGGPVGIGVGAALVAAGAWMLLRKG